MDPTQRGAEPPHIQHALDALAALEAHRAARGASGDLQREIAQLVLDLRLLADANHLHWPAIRKDAKAGYIDVREHIDYLGYDTPGDFPLGTRVAIMWPGAPVHGRTGTVTGALPTSGAWERRYVQLDGEAGTRAFEVTHLREPDPHVPAPGPASKFAPGDHVGWQSDPHENPGRYLDATVLEVGLDFVSIQTHGRWGTSPVKLIVPPRELVKYGQPRAPGLEPIGLQLDDRVAVKAPHRRQGQTGRVIGRSPSSIDVRFDDGFADTFAREALLLVHGAETPPDPAPDPGAALPPFHVGDRVRVSDAGYTHDQATGVIIERALDGFRVRFDNGQPWWFPESHLTHLPAEPAQAPDSELQPPAPGLHLAPVSREYWRVGDLVTLQKEGDVLNGEQATIIDVADVRVRLQFNQYPHHVQWYDSPDLIAVPHATPPPQAPQ